MSKILQIYVDESGDTGLKLNAGSSKYFVVVFVWFAEETAIIKDKMSRVRKEAGCREDFEFHFKGSSQRQRENLVGMLQKLNFTFTAIVVRKSRKLYELGVKRDIYLRCINKFLQATDAEITETNLVIDRTFRKEEIPKLEANILLNSDEKVVTVIQNDSHKDDLLQIADYLAGIINRWQKNKKSGEEYYEMIYKKAEQIIII